MATKRGAPANKEGEGRQADTHKQQRTKQRPTHSDEHTGINTSLGSVKNRDTHTIRAEAQPNPQQ